MCAPRGLPDLAPVARLALATAFVLSPAHGACPETPLDQNWSAAIKQKFWFTSQGSQIMPYAWFVALETPWSERLFRDPHVMDDLLGYISVPASPLNPDALPIGFAKDTDGGETYVGLTCAACHTARIEIGETARIVEGAPGGGDFETLLSWVVDALEKTLGDPAKFDRFASRVLGPAASDAAKADLRARLTRQKDDLFARRDRNRHPEPYGYARVDAFGHILNEVLVKDLGRPENRREPNAPVSYPFLWDTPHHDRVQWNGVAPNTAILGIGPLFRNIGEAVGVFGKMKLAPRPGLPPSYPSSIDKAGLRELEQMLGSLWSPLWPWGCFPLDQGKVARGKTVYQANCQGCHPLIDRRNPHRKIVAKMLLTSEVGTDPAMAKNFAERRARTGPLKGMPVRFLAPVFGSEAAGAEILGHAVLGIYVGKTFSAPGPLPEPTAALLATKNQVDAILDSMIDKRPRYKARPLDGIWATAPYLHNGSVPNLRQMLTKPADRPKQFYVGNRALDPANVGLSTEQHTHRRFLFDATKPGNLNSGHPFGTALSDAEKEALLEFLKQL